jgi:hypothetical protein
LLSTLKLLLSEQSDRNNLKELIEYSSQTALQFLNKKYQFDRNKFLKLGYTFTDIAIDAITPLFIINQKTNELGIVKSLKDWQRPIDTEDAAQYFINKIVVNRVEQELIRIYKDADPFFAKIHDSVSFIAEKEGYLKQTCFGTVYVCFENKDEKQLMPADQFERIPDSLFAGKIKSVIINLFGYLEKETEYQAAIPVNAFIHRIKRIHFSDSAFNQTYISEHFEERIDVAKIIAESLDTTLLKLNNSYSHKLNEEEHGAIKKALADISVDFSNGGLSNDLYGYLGNHLSPMNKEMFYKKYHSILDYLLRIMKKEIILHLDANNKFSNER